MQWLSDAMQQAITGASADFHVAMWRHETKANQLGPWSLCSVDLAALSNMIQLVYDDELYDAQPPNGVFSCFILSLTDHVGWNAGCKLVNVQLMK